MKKYTATTSPGTFSKLYNSKGDAHLINGRYGYKKGKHNGYDALVQAEEFTVWRDPEKSGVRYETSLVESGWFGINLHAGGISKEVSNWSAGCQVIWGGRDIDSPFLEFMQNVNSLLDDDEVVYYSRRFERDPSLSDFYSVGVMIDAYPHKSRWHRVFNNQLDWAIDGANMSEVQKIKDDFTTDPTSIIQK